MPDARCGHDSLLAKQSRREIDGCANRQQANERAQGGLPGQECHRQRRSICAQVRLAWYWLLPNNVVVFRLNYAPSPTLCSRPPSRGGISHGSRPSSAAYERPLSAMKKDRLRVPTGGAAMIAGRKIEDVHPTIQQSTFGASWAAPAL